MWEGWGGGTEVTDGTFPIHSMEPKVQLAVPRLFPGPPSHQGVIEVELEVGEMWSPFQQSLRPRDLRSIWQWGSRWPVTPGVLPADISTCPCGA